MEFSWSGFGFAILATVLQGAVSYGEDTFHSGQAEHVNVPFIWHWGVSVNGFILAVVNGLMLPALHFSVLSPVVLLVSIVITWLAFKSWWPKTRWESCPVQIYHIRSGGHKKQWYKDVMVSGWLFFIFFVSEVAMIIHYVFTPVMGRVAFMIGALLLAIPPFGVLEVNCVVHRRDNFWFDRSAIILTLIGEAAIIIVTYLKM